jgi:hypothetical protein
MDLTRLVSALADPAAYPDPVDAVKVRQAHISAVFLAGSHAYTVRKDLVSGSLDYSSASPPLLPSERAVPTAHRRPDRSRAARPIASPRASSASDDGSGTAAMLTSPGAPNLDGASITALGPRLMPSAP